MKLRIALAFLIGFAAAYAWQHQPPQPPAPPCAQPVNAGPHLKDNLYWAPWVPVRDA